jgi:hypothetical protein
MSSFTHLRCMYDDEHIYVGYTMVKVATYHGRWCDGAFHFCARHCLVVTCFHIIQSRASSLFVYVIMRMAYCRKWIVTNCARRTSRRFLFEMNFNFAPRHIRSMRRRCALRTLFSRSDLFSRYSSVRFAIFVYASVRTAYWHKCIVTSCVRRTFHRTLFV